MSKRTKTPSFILELAIKVSPGQSKVIRSRFEAGRNLYNALLSEAVKRLKALRNSPEYQAARATPKTPEYKEEKRAAFKEARSQYGFTEYALHAFATTARTNWIAEHIDANTAQTLATRAFRATDQVVFGKAKKVRFKSLGRGLDSLEGKSQKQGLRFVLEENNGSLVWGKLVIPALIDWTDPVIYHALREAGKIKYARLVSRKASSPRAEGADCTGQRYYVQLVIEGKSYQKLKNAPGNAVIGLDIGPSTIAAVSQDGGEARLELFCAEIMPDAKAKRRLQRKLDRQRRAGNPDNFDQKGRITRGKRLVWNNSHSYQITRRRLATTDRKLSAHRKSLQGALANSLVRVGNVIKTEKVSYKGWQKLYGKSVGTRGPGMFVEKLKRTVARTGGTFLEFSTRTTKLSQLCHACGSLTKKPLSQRWHKCECGLGPVQRDLYSAWLASHINLETQILSATLKWEGVESRLMAVTDSLNQRAIAGEEFPQSMGLTRARARLPESLLPTTAKNLVLNKVKAVSKDRTPRLKAWGWFRAE